MDTLSILEQFESHDESETEMISIKEEGHDPNEGEVIALQNNPSYANHRNAIQVHIYKM